MSSPRLRGDVLGLKIIVWDSTKNRDSKKLELAKSREMSVLVFFIFLDIVIYSMDIILNIYLRHKFSLELFFDENKTDALMCYFILIAAQFN